MNPIEKRSLSERDICTKFITPDDLAPQKGRRLSVHQRNAIILENAQFSAEDTAADLGPKFHVS